MASIRIKRLEKELFKIISNTVSLKLRDKRLSCVTITSVRLTNDMSLAKVYFTQYDNLADAVVQDTLQRSSGAIKKVIAAAKLMRTIPNIRFHFDKLEENARSLDDIFAQIRRESSNGEDEAVSEEEILSEEEAVLEESVVEEDASVDEVEEDESIEEDVSNVEATAEEIDSKAKEV